MMLKHFRGRVLGRHLPQRDRIADRGQRIPQLVGQHGQKFVLLPTRFLNRVEQPRVIDRDRHALGQAFGQRHFALRVPPPGIAGHQPDDADRAVANFQAAR